MKPADNHLDLRAKSIVSYTEAVGLVQKAFGNNGELVVKLRDTFPDDHTEPLWVEIDSMAVPLFISSMAPQGVSKAVIIFDDFASKERAGMLIGRELYSGQEPSGGKEDTDDWSILEGFAFEDCTSGRKGVVAGYIDNPNNPLMEVRLDSGNYLVPFSGELTEKIDRRRKIVKMSLPEGIFDL